MHISDMGDFPKSQREAVRVNTGYGTGLECNPPRHYPGNNSLDNP